MKETSYDDPPLHEESVWEKNDKKNKASEARLWSSAGGRNVMREKSMSPRDQNRITPVQREVRVRPLPSHEEHEEMHLGRIILVLFIVLSFGLGVGAYALVGTKVTSPILEGPNNKATSTPPKITNEDIDILLTDSPRAQLLADISIAFGKTYLPEGGVRKVHFLTKGERGITREATVKEFFGTINKFPGSDALVRSLDTSLMYEIDMNNGLVGKITMLSRSYPNTFAEMLDWESAIATDLLPALHPGMTQNKLKEAEGRVFRDERIGDIDTRVLLDPLGNPLIVYGFVDGKTLIIAGGRGVFTPVLPATDTK